MGAVVAHSGGSKNGANSNRKPVLSSHEECDYVHRLRGIM